MGFERLFDYLFGWIRYLKFWDVVDAYEAGVVLRFGKMHRTVGPGIHWIAPFGIETVLSDNVVFSTMDLASQVLTTSDSQQVVVSAVVAWSIQDIEKFLLQAEDAESILNDAARIAIRHVIQSRRWEEITALTPEEFDDELTSQARASQPGRYGVKIHSVRLSDGPARVRTIKLMQD